MAALDMRTSADEEEQLEQNLGKEVLYMLLAFFMGCALYLYMNKRPTQAEFDEVSGKYTALLKETGHTDKEVEAKFKKPPLITLSDAEGFSFPSGTALITQEFLAKLKLRIIPEILARAKEHGLDLVEVVGHTDEVPINTKGRSNLDQRLIALLQGKMDADMLTAVDNTGLAMMRAAVIAMILMDDPRIKAAKLTVVPFSAGQLVNCDGKPTAGGLWTDPKRRRIDLRLRKLAESAEVKPK